LALEFWKLLEDWHGMCIQQSIMKHLKYILAALSLFLMLGLAQNAKAQNPDDVFTKVTSAIQAGNAEALSALLQSPVEITLPGADQAYSAQQATFVIKDFFAKFPPKSFKVLHKGNSGPTHYATGSYVSANGTFDANIFLKKVDAGFKVSQLRFEAE
jgi:hypothetical protein